MSKKKLAHLTTGQNRALTNVRCRLLDMSFVESILLYGSVARGEADEGLDIDLLVLTSKKLTRPERHQITDMVYEIKLAEDTNFSTLVVDRTSWENGIFSVPPMQSKLPGKLSQYIPAVQLLEYRANIYLDCPAMQLPEYRANIYLDHPIARQLYCRAVKDSSVKFALSEGEF